MDAILNANGASSMPCSDSLSSSNDKIIIGGFVSDLSFSFLSVSSADIESGEIDRKNLLYCRNDLRRVLLLTESERMSLMKFGLKRDL